VGVRVRHTDGERRQLRIDQGKGGKDRLVDFGEQLLLALREYWRRFRPGDWLFPSAHALDTHISESSACKVHAARERTGIEKLGVKWWVSTDAHRRTQTHLRGSSLGNCA